MLQQQEINERKEEIKEEEVDVVMTSDEVNARIRNLNVLTGPDYQLSQMIQEIDEPLDNPPIDIVDLIFPVESAP